MDKKEVAATGELKTPGSLCAVLQLGWKGQGERQGASQ